MPRKNIISTEFTVEINRDLEGRYQVSVDGRVRRSTFDEQEAVALARALNPKFMPSDERDQMLGRAIGRSGL